MFRQHLTNRTPSSQSWTPPAETPPTVNLHLQHLNILTDVSEFKSMIKELCKLSNEKVPDEAMLDKLLAGADIRDELDWDDFRTL